VNPLVVPYVPSVGDLPLAQETTTIITTSTNNLEGDDV
jgi:hypothetical protein